MRYFLDLAYCGTAYHGWQLQKNAHTVQAEVNNALSTYLREPINVTASGRTDAGVHALQQIVHFDYSQELDPSQTLFKLNALMPEDIAAKNLWLVHDQAHARFDAVLRSYVYRIHRSKSPFLKEQSYFFPHELDVDGMNQAAVSLTGRKNFQCFSRVKTDVNTFECNLQTAHWNNENESLTFHVSADRFLRGMVRAIVGTLLLIGEGKMKLSQLAEVIESRDRRRAGRAVPAYALYLKEVNYPDSIFK